MSSTRIAETRDRAANDLHTESVRAPGGVTRGWYVTTHLGAKSWEQEQSCLRTKGAPGEEPRRTPWGITIALGGYPGN